MAVFADPDEKTAKVVVPDYQLSLAIGKEGQNARLAARLTGYKIDIKSETQAKDAVGFRYEDYVYDDEEYEDESYDGEENFEEDYDGDDLYDETEEGTYEADAYEGSDEDAGEDESFEEETYGDEIYGDEEEDVDEESGEEPEEM